MILLLCGCGEVRVAKFRSDAELVRGSHHTHAIYGNNLYLLSDPLNDIYREATQWHANVGEKISDLYVIAHGWNFTTEEALANYYGYLEVVERRIAAVRRENPTYNPYFVFVVWPSAARPLSSIVDSALPYDAFTFFKPIMEIIDGTVFFLPSLWKQSINAHKVATGTKPRESYIASRDYSFGGWTKLPLPTCGTTTPRSTEYFTIDRSPVMGRDCPLSLLINHIIDWKRKFSPATHVHLVGHSFGAKMVTLAAVEALATLYVEEGGWLSNPDQSIESLVLLNPAFAPQELQLMTFNVTPSFSPEHGSPWGENFIREPRWWVPEMLDRIPQKVLVYSDRDYAAGRIFDLSQIVMSNSLTQYTAELLKSSGFGVIESYLAHERHVTNWVLDGVLRAENTIAAGMFIVQNLAFGPLMWTAAKLTDMPDDFFYHVKNNDLFLKQEQAYGYRVILREALNALDFVMPVLHVVRNDPADQMGILRNSSAALGSTGWNLALAGRKINHPANFVSLAEKAQTPPTLFCHYSSRIMKILSPIAPAEIHDSDGRSEMMSQYALLDPNVMNSFDGTTVLDTWYPPDGAHGDVRSTEPPSHCSAQDEHGRLLQKREMIFNFVYNVTHAKLVPGLRRGAH